MYDKYIEKNSKIILVIEQMIKSYQLISDNQSNIYNILNNCCFNEENKSKIILKNYDTLDLLSKDVKNYFNEEFIILHNSKTEGLENKYLFFCQPIKTFIELDESVCASCSNCQSKINLYDLSNPKNEIYSFKAHLEDINWIIKSNKNNIISCGEDGLIKIWPKITKNLFVKKNSTSSEKKDLKGYINKKVNDIFLNPIYETKFEHKDIIKIKKMLNLKNDKFIAFSNSTIFIFRYIIDEDKNYIQIELIKSNDFKNIINEIFVIEKDNKEIIVIYNDYFLSFLDITNFGIIYKLNTKKMTPNSLIQLNQNYLLFQEGHNLKLFDINKFKSKLIIKNNYKNEFLLNMNDGTIIQSTFYGIKRYLIKTMEELPNLICLDNDDDDYFESDSYDGYDAYNDRISYIYKLKDGRVITFYLSGLIGICSLKFF